MARTRDKKPDPIKQIVRWHGNAKMVSYEDTRWGPAVERAKAEDPPRLVFPLAEFPPGWYAIESRTTMPGGLWTVHLDPETGRFVGPHNCPARAENPRGNVPCIHMALAWLYFKVEQQERDPFIKRLRAQENQLASPGETSTALVPRESQQAAPLAPFEPSREQIGARLSLAKVLFETRGAAIPKNIKTVQEAAAIILAGEAVGFDPMTSFRRIFTVDGRTQLDSQGMAALIQRAGGELVYNESTDEVADVTLVRPGRAPLTVRYTIEQAQKSGLTETEEWSDTPQGRRPTGKKKKKKVWEDFPADMLIWKAVARLARRGAADLVNTIQTSMVAVEDVADVAAQVGWNEERPDAEHEERAEQRQLAQQDHEDGEYEELREESPSTITSSGSESPTTAQSQESPTAAAATAPASTPSDPAVQPQHPATAEAGASSPEPGHASEPAAPAASTPTTDERGLNYKAVMSNKAQHIAVLSAFQKAIQGLGSLPEAAAEMSLNEIVDSMGGTWPQKGN